MKVLFVNAAMEGHHTVYLRALCSIKEIEPIVITPSKLEGLKCKQIVNRDIQFITKQFKEFIKFINFVRNVTQEEKPDILHFLYGDMFYRFMGIGIGWLNKYRTVITLHHLRRGLLHDISLKRLFKNMDAVVVHTESIYEELSNIGIKRICHIEYPHFHETINFSQEEARQALSLPLSKKILLYLGNTRYDKGLDVLLEALKFINRDFYLIIAGKEADFTKDYIIQQTESYKDRVFLKNDYLSDADFMLSLIASDYLVLPYRKSFNGASGPLTEAVWLRKNVIGPNHGSLGSIIEANSLGFVFEAENVNDLAKVINKALVEEPKWSQKAENYRDRMNVERFIDEYEMIYQCLLEQK